ncbi:acidic ribosomal protein P0 [Ordospora colligata]|uniref:Large ribosomal subunit protein uL10 n=1 Tax=Ordospora colligata OC4 TaxID=1354746 RepID=A0A0B2UJF1_9MICR|nr:acidic ribosomal protein P0 [Ordospora colligata OC4]KHN69344.1 acidic ribosomal protein P0 [Ordospora colligata OC4]TBU14858.1 acidic ribosomal protein P0 [Ordospora colligata]TBU14989.1 acidic ribosomal protein P0 [Ordospora colligata]TBU18243.1 acidic ribosomal protein P0 [Ordospora colligata]
MAGENSRRRKEHTYEKAKRLFSTYSKFAIIGVENVVSTQLKNIKVQWGKDAEFLMGKNSSMRRALQDLGKSELDVILEKIKGDVCFVFFKNNVKVIKKVIDNNAREACAKIGDISQKDVWVEKCVTSMPPDKTSYFQVLGIATKITKGKIEIISDYKVLSPGDHVGPSQANLLSMMNIKPFMYKISMWWVYEDGCLYESALVDIEEDDIMMSMKNAIQSVAAMSLGARFVTQASVPYAMRNAFKDILHVSFGAEFAIKEQSMVA